MSFTNTIVGLRKSSRTVLASNGLRITADGVIVNHKANRVSRVYQDQVLFASTFNEVADEQLRNELNAELVGSRGDLRKAVRQLAHRMRLLPALLGQTGEAMVGSRELLATLDMFGNLCEPEEGFAAVGSAALIAMGAARALAGFSGMEIDQIARESLLLAATISNYANDQIFLEVV
jgi:ATP-dependent HslUV protease subunit HslV